HAVRRTFWVVVGAVRYVIAHDVRHLAGLVAPLVLPAAGFVGFSLLTGGTDAIGYWLLAILATVLLGVFFAYWVGIFVTLFEPVGNLVGRALAFPVRRFSPKWASRVKEAASTLTRVLP